MNGVSNTYKKHIAGITVSIIILLVLNNIVAYEINSILKLNQVGIIIVKLLMYLLVYIIVMYLFKINPKKYLKEKFKIGSIGLICVGIVLNFIVNIILGQIFGQGINRHLSLYEYLNNIIGIHVLLKQPFGIIYLGILTVIVAPVLEEMVFRGFMVNTIYENTKSKALSIVISSLLFGLMHLSLGASITAFAYGIIASSIYLRCKDIKVTIIMHSTINIITLCLLMIK